MKAPEQPTSQNQEVLFELITRMNIDRRTMMLSANVWNLTARISYLRYKGVRIKSNVIKSKNKYNREIEFVQYSLEDKKQAIAVYNEMKTNEAGIPV